MRAYLYGRIPCLEPVAVGTQHGKGETPTLRSQILTLTLYTCTLADEAFFSFLLFNSALAAGASRNHLVFFPTACFATLSSLFARLPAPACRALWIVSRGADDVLPSRKHCWHH